MGCKERLLNDIRSNEVEQNGTEVAGCAACAPWAKTCIVFIDMINPRPNARPKCSNCTRGSGKHCSHSNLILDIQRFKKYGAGLRIPEYNAFFRNEKIDVWGPSIGLSIRSARSSSARFQAQQLEPARLFRSISPGGAASWSPLSLLLSH